MVQAYLYIIAISTFMVVDIATSIPSTFTRSLSSQRVKEQPFLPSNSSNSSSSPKRLLSRSSTMSEIVNDGELPLNISETSLYSTCHINSSKNQENSTARADVEDVENDGLKKWELFAWEEYKKCEIYSQRAYSNMPTKTGLTLSICLCLFYNTYSSVFLNART